MYIQSRHPNPVPGLGQSDPGKVFPVIFVELLIPPNTDIHHRGLRGLNWKLPTSEINLNRLAVRYCDIGSYAKWEPIYPESKSSKERA